MMSVHILSLCSQKLDENETNKGGKFLKKLWC